MLNYKDNQFHKNREHCLLNFSADFFFTTLLVVVVRGCAELAGHEN
jgi:hypothetical protein